MERVNEWSPDPLHLWPGVPPKTEDAPPKGETTVLPFGARCWEPLVFTELGVARFDLGVGSPGVRGGVVVLCTNARLPLFAGEGEVSIGVELRPFAFGGGDPCNGPGSVTVR